MQDRTCALWEFLSDRYKDKQTIAGYDLLNEAVLEDNKVLNKFYNRLIKAIRTCDKNHILFVEGNKWATDLACLDYFDDDNLALSIHFYAPLEMTFNLVPHLSYPLRSKKEFFGKSVIKDILRGYYNIAKKWSRPVLLGEFGVNYRQGYYGEDKWLQDVLSCANDFGFHWTYWTYKAVKNGTFPDGLFSYMANPLWVSRHGPRMGWDNYSECWPKLSKKIIESWQTNNFQPNMALLKILKKMA